MRFHAFFTCICGFILLVVLVSPPGFSQTKPAKPELEYRAFVFTQDAALATRRLNDLAEEGWEYVGPLGNSLVAFKRSTTKEARERQETAKLQGRWQSADGATIFEVDGKSWSWSNSQTNKVTASGTLEEVIYDKGIISADLYHETGSLKESTVHAIFQIDGDTLLYSGADSPDERPKNFVKGQFSQWKKIKR